MKSFVFFLLVTAVLSTEGAKWVQRWQHSQRVWRLQYAVQQATEAKADYQQQNSDNQNALDAFDQDTPEGREQTLIDAGLLSDQTALCLVDPGALDEQPRAHTVAEMEEVAHRARVGAGTLALAMR